MTSFNDDDLNRLEEYISREYGDNCALPAVIFDVGSTKALLARLEAAELLSAVRSDLLRRCNIPPDDYELMAERQWRQSKGEK